MSLTVTLHRPADLAAPVAVLSRAESATFQERLNEAGTGSCVLANDDAALSLVAPGDVLRFDLDGQTAFSAIVRSVDRVSLNEAGELAQVTTLGGAGLLAALDEAVVYPSRGLSGAPIEETRLFSWMSPDYDDSWWGGAMSFGPVAANSTVAWYGVGGVWADSAKMIWTTGVTDRLAPGGWCYFRKTFYVAEDTRARVSFVADDQGDAYLDGGEVASTNPWGNLPGDVIAVEVDLSAGTHTLAFMGYNHEGPPDDIDGPFNPAMAAASVVPLDVLGNAGPPLVVTDETWKVLAYPATPPGMTPGDALLHVINEAKARGCLLNLEVAFTGAADSAGVAWPVVGDISTRVGNDALTFVRELTETYVDVWMDPLTFTLHAWAQGGRGALRPVELHAPRDASNPRSGNLAGLTHRRLQ